MPEAGFFEQKRQSPTGLVIVVAAHAAAITALALAKMEIPSIARPGPVEIFDVPVAVDPPPIPPEPVERQDLPTPRSTVSVPDPIVPPRPSDSNPITTQSPPPQPTWTQIATGTAETVKVPPLPPVPPEPFTEPVRTKAKLKAGIELLPPYPQAEERAEAEGTVVVRLIIGPDGRVRSVEKISAASEAFWRATERHALRAWRFSPATVDGKPVESSQTMTVKFELRG